MEETKKEEPKYFIKTAFRRANKQTNKEACRLQPLSHSHSSALFSTFVPSQSFFWTISTPFGPELHFVFSAFSCCIRIHVRILLAAASEFTSSCTDPIDGYFNSQSFSSSSVCLSERMKTTLSFLGGGGGTNRLVDV